ncbi:uncharacterized protein LOC123320887 [Coccinella septempunctata]|uniref:uncharacterized protein LOC123320887 n=1 Tax=Coccinella septempunctata TaxID=41139 RepID=UPI001D087490|nr:uncharacterized protein LOC123320887 [Coccinella septempunctata]
MYLKIIKRMSHMILSINHQYSSLRNEENLLFKGKPIAMNISEVNVVNNLLDIEAAVRNYVEILTDVGVVTVLVLSVAPIQDAALPIIGYITYRLLLHYLPII